MNVRLKCFGFVRFNDFKYLLFSDFTGKRQRCYGKLNLKSLKVEDKFLEKNCYYKFNKGNLLYWQKFDSCT